MKEVQARAAARQRLLNALVRETDAEVAAGELRMTLRGAHGTLVAEVCRESEVGHHVYGDGLFRESGGSRARLEHDEFVALVAEELQRRGAPTPPGSAERFRRQVANSEARSARYLARRAGPPPAAPTEITRHAEQSLLLGHPFHPTPKSAEGIADDDLERYAPELEARFRLHYWAVAPEVLLEERIGCGRWIPERVEREARTLLGAAREHFELLPVHPWQADYLRSRAAELIAEGELVPLGPLGDEVYATSSVRTVCDPAFGTAWKLPLHVRITNFVRNNPLEHLRRAVDAGRLVAAADWDHDGFRVLPETGYRAIAPGASGELAADFAVLFRHNPFPGSTTAPRVLAALLEDRLDGTPPPLIEEIARAGPLVPEHVVEWLRCYLRISLGPLLSVFTEQGISFEAHVQNSLLHTEDGWPRTFYVRDMEGTSASGERIPAGVLPTDSPVRYDDVEAWLRLRYHFVTNHLGHLVAVLGRFTPAGERLLWSAVHDFLAHCPGRYAERLRRDPALPAKANLISRFAEHGESPLYVDIPNPIREVNR
ncbi:L-2,3-diaminopropanoate--citrate ligase SbnE [Saccharopolyspora halophila]|uniref:L-2,3-diaminopropanoate--citrate ligase SbnE n=1 Tax=Saccharopolyspora halophila TaxID=405551 RepID=A0ABN3GUQ2_9PSEU